MNISFFGNALLFFEMMGYSVLDSIFKTFNILQKLF
uniref:Uncharacterized protein n=1 Tax=Arundo donax TaxID=35708 RepID=A0A0A8Z010_ARUDO